MAVEVSYPHIVKSPGEPARLARQSRTRVAQIVMDYTEYGWSADEIQRQHPYLTLAAVHSALAYYFDHVEEIDREIEEEWKESQRLAKATPPAPFLARLKALKRRNADAALS
jgi:uncharacterized protein (DUF433 family)